MKIHKLRVIHELTSQNFFLLEFSSGNIDIHMIMVPLLIQDG